MITVWRVKIIFYKVIWTPHNKMSEYYLWICNLKVAGFEVITAVVKKSSTFWDITPYSPLKVNWRFEGTCPLATCFVLVSYLAYSLTLRREAKCFSETGVDFQRTTQRYIPENITCMSNVQIPSTCISVDLLEVVWKAILLTNGRQFYM
jgi:hypothetical protein